MNNKNYYLFNKEEIFEKFSSSEKGLTKTEAENRLQKDGPNEFDEARMDSYLFIFLKQFKSPLIYILLVSGVIVFLMGEMVDTVVIFAVIFFNSIVGAIQEGKAQSTFLALKNFIKGDASVLRDGREIIIPDSEVVAGDVITLREGEKIPADARIIFSNALQVNEAALTGESAAKFKNAENLSGENLAVADQNNMVFKGTIVVSGNGKAVVVATGMKTFIGSVAKQALEINTEFPLKDDIKKLSRFIIITVAITASLVFGWGIANGYPIEDLIKMIIAIAVSVIPEGLPIVLTLVLASGVWRMGKKNVLVKKMQAVEVLGEIKVLAVDKTGTVTKNELVVRKAIIGKNHFEISGVGYESAGNVSWEEKIIDPLNHSELLLAGKIAALGSSANLILDEKNDVWKISGDPTEGAMLVFSKKIGFNKDDLLAENPLLDEIPFDYHSKIHFSLYENKKEKNNFLVASGSPEELIELSDREWTGEKTQKISDKRKEEIKNELEKMFAKGLRVIAFGYLDFADDKLDKNNLPKIILGGFLGIQDALREEVKEAVERVSNFGIKVVMITGDHEITARAIAEEAGIFKKGDTMLSGMEIEKMKSDELDRKIKTASVFYRVTPEHKLRIIKAYRDNKIMVAMTGDGVNDALSLSAADIGIGMGKVGTEVAKEASDFILLDDNFGSIINGITEGKTIITSIKKVVLYLVSTSIGEVLTILGALLVGLPLPILAAQVLWLNLVTDGFLDVALAMDHNEGRVKKNVQGKRASLINRNMIIRTFIMAVTMAAGTLYLFAQNYHQDITKAWTISLTTLALFQWFNAWNCRDEKRSLFTLNPLKNKYLILATVVVGLLQILAVYNPFLQKILKTVPLNFSDWLIIIAVSLSIVFVEEIRKVVYRIMKAQLA